jgi:flagellar biosynthesis protein FlhF
MEALLAAAEAPKDLAARLCAQWFAAAAHRDSAQHVPILRQIVAGTAQTDCELSEGESRPRIVTLVGPSGAGKTTTIVKLAARYGLASRRPAQFISFDNFRIGGAAQLATFASILGVPFCSADTVGGLMQALEPCQNKGLILIDTAGYDNGDDAEAAELGRFLRSRTDIDVHLTLPASMKPADLTRAADRFAPFRADKLIFTRLDETSTFGPILAEAVRQGKPLSFFSNGPQIPEDLQEASPELVARLLLDGSDCGTQRIIDDGFVGSAGWRVPPSGNEAAA